MTDPDKFLDPEAEPEMEAEIELLRTVLHFDGHSVCATCLL